MRIMIKITDIHLEPGFTKETLQKAAAKKLKLPASALHNVRLVKKSVDARDKARIHFVCAAQASVDADEEKLVQKLRSRNVQIQHNQPYQLPRGGKLSARPVIVGFGPAGLFAALILAQCGENPIVIEQGESVEKRGKSVSAFWKTGKLNSASNVQFGEGGAGTFSDGKLTTGTKDRRIQKVLSEFIAAGAPPEIAYEAKPHIGTDRLPGVVKNMRETIIALGGEVRFETKATGFRETNGKISALELENPDGSKEILACRDLILAAGHSARDTFETLCAMGVAMQAKSFSVGARIEHPAALINRAQYGDFADVQALGTADYKLSVQLQNGRGVYTFCMCPGGVVTGAASEPGIVVTNGMSTYLRDGENSNSALLVGVTPEDFGKNPLDGIAFQRAIEQQAFLAAGADYSMPGQRVGDFLSGNASHSFGTVRPTAEPGVVPGNLCRCLPDFVTGAMAEGIVRMNRFLRGFSMEDAVLTAPETRSSSPVRILRGEDRQSLTLKGLYPCGEGAGYAGGIMSAAVDGIRTAEALLHN